MNRMEQRNDNARLCALNFDKAPRQTMLQLQQQVSSTLAVIVISLSRSGITFITFNKRMSFQCNIALSSRLLSIFIY